jgi:hypothetical protein
MEIQPTKYNKRTKMFQIRFSTPEFEEIKTKVKSKGFGTVSTFLRYMALEHEIMIESKILETNRIVKEIIEKINKN